MNLLSIILAAVNFNRIICGTTVNTLDS
jgi:hypothetical protein